MAPRELQKKDRQPRLERVPISNHGESLQVSSEGESRRKSCDVCRRSTLLGISSQHLLQRQPINNVIPMEQLETFCNTVSLRKKSSPRSIISVQKNGRLWGIYISPFVLRSYEKKGKHFKNDVLEKSASRWGPRVWTPERTSAQLGVGASSTPAFIRIAQN